MSANGQKIEYSRQATLNLAVHNLRCESTWMFVIADTINPLLGYDFLNHVGLTVDCTNNKLIDATTDSLTQNRLLVNQDNAADTTVRRIMEKYLKYNFTSSQPQCHKAERFS